MFPICPEAPRSGPSAFVPWCGTFYTNLSIRMRSSIKHSIYTQTHEPLYLLSSVPSSFLYHTSLFASDFPRKYHLKAKFSSFHHPDPPINGKRHSIPVLDATRPRLVWGWLLAWLWLAKYKSCKNLSLGLEIYFSRLKLGRVSYKAKHSRKYGRSADVWTGSL
jgi:hypothetical protein